MKKILYLFLLVLFCTSCNNFLDVNPDNTGHLDSPEDVRLFLVNGYPSFTYFYFAELLSDNLVDVGTNYPGDLLDPDLTKKTYFWETNQLEEYDFPALYFYSCYGAIAYANYALEAIEKMEKEGKYSSEETDPLKGEALLIRAYSHFMVANIFSEHYDPNTAASTMSIPYITKAERNADVTYERNTVQEVYDLINEDIATGYPLINDKVYQGKDKWHFNRNAAAAFATRFYLYRGLPTDWDEVIKYGRVVLGTDASSLLRDFNEFNTIPDYDQRMIDYSRSKYPTNLLLTNTYSYGVDQMHITRYTTTNPQLNAVVQANIYPTINGSAGGRFLPGKGTLGYGVTYPTAFLPRYYQDFKRDNINSTSGFPFVTTVLFSVEEVLFNVAEAYVMKEAYGSAVDLLNQYMSTRLSGYNASNDIITEASVIAMYQSNTQVLRPHYALNTNQYTFMKCLLTMRRSEFLYLGLRWFDIKRMHLEVTHNVIDGPVTYDIVLAPNSPRRVMELPASVTAAGVPGNFNVQNSVAGLNAILEDTGKSYLEYMRLKNFTITIKE